MTRKVRILDVKYNASNNELVRTQTLVKNAIVEVDAAPFKQWYLQHYGVELGKKGAVEPAAGEEKKVGCGGRSTCFVGCPRRVRRAAGRSRRPSWERRLFCSHRVRDTCRAPSTGLQPRAAQGQGARARPQAGPAPGRPVRAGPPARLHQLAPRPGAAARM